MIHGGEDLGVPRQPIGQARVPGGALIFTSPNSRSEMQESGRTHVLDPVDRLSEMIFGLIMVLTYTTAINVVDAGPETIREMLIAAIGCNAAWGLVDGVMYLLSSLSDRSRRAALILGLQRAPSPEAGIGLLRASLDEDVVEYLGPDGLLEFAGRLRRVDPDSLVSGWITLRDLRGAVACALLVFLSTFPVVIPFMLVREPLHAMRWSNGVAIVMLFLLGASWSKVTHGRPLRDGLALVLIGLVLVGITVALGG